MEAKIEQGGEGSLILTVGRRYRRYELETTGWSLCNVIWTHFGNFKDPLRIKDAVLVAMLKVILSDIG